MRTRLFAVVAALAALGGCVPSSQTERADHARLQAFLDANRSAYDEAVGVEREVIREIARTSDELRVGTNAALSERLRQKVLRPKHTYKYIHDRLTSMRLSGSAGERGKRIAEYFKDRELTLLPFTKLLTEIRDANSAANASDAAARLAGAAAHYRDPSGLDAQ